MEQLRRELADLDRMEAALGIGIPPLDGGVEIPPLPAPVVIPRAPARRHIEGGIKGAVMGLLTTAYPNGLTAQEILKALKDKTQIDIPRTSLSPQLSRLKKDKQVVMNEGEWSATEQGMLDWLMS